MHQKDDQIKLDFLDHVAIRVKDLHISAEWYHRVLNLKKYHLPAWGEFPILMLSGKTGIALFPAKLDDTQLDPHSRNVKIDHFAFQVSRENFDKAKRRYQDLKLEFQIQDHHYFHSIYTKDPDGHTVELTTLVVDEEAFYGQQKKSMD